jgi:hypothetical protein
VPQGCVTGFAAAEPLELPQQDFAAYAASFSGTGQSLWVCERLLKLVHPDEVHVLAAASFEDRPSSPRASAKAAAASTQLQQPAPRAHGYVPPSKRAAGGKTLLKP